MSSGKILLFENNQKFNKVLADMLIATDFTLHCAEDGLSAFEVFEEVDPDIVILNVSLPYKNGLNICLEIRGKSEVPIIFLAEQLETNEVIRGLSLGGDHFVIKPCGPEVIIALIQAVFRRFPPKNERLSIDNLHINFATNEITLAGNHLLLSAKEREILLLLARNPNKVFTLEQLYQEIWGSSSFGDNRTVLVHVSNLRRKLAEDPSDSRYIQTVRGQGYMFKP